MGQEPEKKADSLTEEFAGKEDTDGLKQDILTEESTEDKLKEDKSNDEKQRNTDGKEEKPVSKKASIIKDLITYAIIFIVCLYILPTFVIQKTIVDGPSMENTLHNGDQLMVEKISYRLDDLKRFDIIVFYPYGRKDKEYYVKRVIGLPGETVQIKGKDIYINDKKLTENYGKEPITKAGIAANPIKLADDEYFVMGDHREVSFDSRYEEVGPVKKENIGGKVILRIWPLNKFGLLE